MKHAILIAGATGATGSVATKLLLRKGLPVRAFVHRVDERSSALAKAGAEIAVGDLLDFRAVRRAFDGVERAYFVYPIRPRIVQRPRTAADRCGDRRGPRQADPLRENLIGAMDP